MLAATRGGTPPASTSSKCRRASPSCPFRKNVRASSRRTRMSSGRLTRMSRKAAMALSYRSRRAASLSARSEAASAVMPMRNRASVRGSRWGVAFPGRVLHMPAGCSIASRTGRAGIHRKDRRVVIVGSRLLDSEAGKWLAKKAKEGGRHGCATLLHGLIGRRVPRRELVLLLWQLVRCALRSRHPPFSVAAAPRPGQKEATTPISPTMRL